MGYQGRRRPYQEYVIANRPTSNNKQMSQFIQIQLCETVSSLEGICDLINRQMLFLSVTYELQYMYKLYMKTNQGTHK